MSQAMSQTSTGSFAPTSVHSMTFSSAQEGQMKSSGADHFGCVPFGNIHTAINNQTNIQHHNTVNIQPSSVHNAVLPSSVGYQPHPAVHNTAPPSSVGYQPHPAFNTTSKEQSMKSSNVQYDMFQNAEFHFRDRQTDSEHLEADDYLLHLQSDDENSSDNELGSSLKHSKGKSKTNRGRSPRDVLPVTSGVANMSFHDDDDIDDLQPQSYLSRSDSRTKSGNHGTHGLSVSSIRHPAYTRESSAQIVGKASTEAMKVSSGGYDTFTWPRKQRKVPTIGMATNEPFSSKKKVDVSD